MDETQLITDVIFVFGIGRTQQVFRARERIPSREALGVWHVGKYAWKVYKNRSQIGRILRDYGQADQKRLPMGYSRLLEGQVIEGGQMTYGFALMMECGEGHFFHFQQPPKPFETALRAEHISHSRSSEDYVRIQRGCEIAKELHVSDCQGFVESAVSEPLKFIDIHLAASTSWQAEEMVETIRHWGTQRLQCLELHKSEGEIYVRKIVKSTFITAMFDEYKHDDFDVTSSFASFGGVEKVEPKDKNITHSHFFRKAVKPGDNDDLNKLLEFQELVMKDGCQGTIHPMYDHDGSRWVLMSVPVENYEATGIKLVTSSG